MEDLSMKRMGWWSFHMMFKRIRHCRLFGLESIDKIMTRRRSPTPPRTRGGILRCDMSDDDPPPLLRTSRFNFGNLDLSVLPSPMIEESVPPPIKRSCLESFNLKMKPYVGLLYAVVIVSALLVILVSFGSFVVTKLTVNKDDVKEIAEGVFSRKMRDTTFDDGSPKILVPLQDLVSSDMASKILWRMRLLANREEKAFYNFLVDKICGDGKFVNSTG